MLELELCCECEQLTGRAGRADDSLYINDEGPYCVECFNLELLKPLNWKVGQ